MTGVNRQPLSTLLIRAFRKRCPRCGAGKIFKSFWALHDNCPNCDYRFEREEGYWVGAIIINTAVTETLFLAVFLTILFASLPDIRWLPLLATALVLNGIFPVVFFPYSKTIWMGLNMYFNPASRN
jgi:uncharacterized protein (DUF983 family)